MKRSMGASALLVTILVAGFLFVPSVESDRPVPENGGSHPGNYPASTAKVSRTTSKIALPTVEIDSSVPQALRSQVEGWGFSEVGDPAAASLRVEVRSSNFQGSRWIYALVAPFPTVTDGVTSGDLFANWGGSPAGPFGGRPILMAPSTLAAFTALWGPPSSGAVQSVPEGRLLAEAWAQRPSWAIVPFEALEPRWKVLTVDGQSPIHKDFVPNRYFLQTSFDYPLQAVFTLQCSRPCPFSVLPSLPSTNRDPSKMTTLITTGVTALVRATAYTMNIKGVTYPGRDIRDWFTQADLLHVSNEIPFYDKCPDPNPDQSRLVFCSSPGYVDLLNYIGTDVVELTGNHFADYGPEAMKQTLAIYRQNHIPYYGGGANLEDARKPLLLMNNGNRLAFIGCNSVDVGRMPTATENRSGAAPCDYDYMTSEIQRLQGQGYVVITTFQYYETYVPRPFDTQVHDFRLMVDSGASIVQGSQAHYPQAMEFREGAFIHYGLGNLFFDQMGNSPRIPGIRREFFDRHVIYDNRYIGTELLTAMLEDYSRPRPMTSEERAAFLKEYFTLSGW